MSCIERFAVYLWVRLSVGGREHNNNNNNNNTQDMSERRQEGCEGRHKVEAGSHNCSHVRLFPKHSSVERGHRHLASCNLNVNVKGSSRPDGRGLVLLAKGSPMCLEAGTGRRHRIHHETRPPSWRSVYIANALFPEMQRQQQKAQLTNAVYLVTNVRVYSHFLAALALF